MADTKKTEIKEKTTAKVSVKPKIRFEDKIDEQIKAKVVKIPMITNVYSADFSIIDNTIEEIKKQTRKVGTSYYASNNIYLILEDALKKIILAYH
jgi:uncharacterized membrane protein